MRRCATIRHPAALAIALIALLLAPPLLTPPAHAGPLTPVKLRVGGKEVPLKTPAVFDGREVYLPLDALPAFGAKYTLTGREETAIVMLANGARVEIALARPGKQRMLPLSSLTKPQSLDFEVKEGVCDVRKADAGREKKAGRRPTAGLDESRPHDDHMTARSPGGRTPSLTARGSSPRKLSGSSTPEHLNIRTPENPDTGVQQAQSLDAVGTNPGSVPPKVPSEKPAKAMKPGAETQRDSHAAARSRSNPSEGFPLPANEVSAVGTSAAQQRPRASVGPGGRRDAHPTAQVQEGKEGGDKPARGSGRSGETKADSQGRVQPPGSPDGGSAQTTDGGLKRDDAHDAQRPAGDPLPPDLASRHESGAPMKPPARLLRIEDVAFETTGAQSARIRVKTTGKATPSVVLLREPSRLAIDIPDATLESEKRDWPIEHPFLSAIHAIDGDRPGTTRLILDLTRLVSYRLLPPDSTGLTVNLGLPRGVGRKMSDLVVVVDPGHGGNSGRNPWGCSIVSQGQCIIEKNLTLSIARKVQRQLEEAGATVLMTRTKDVSVGLPERPRLAIENSADVFVSIHIDDCPTPNSASGTTAYYHMDDANSRALAHSVVEHIAQVSGLPSRRARSDRERFAGTGMAVLHCGTIPATLVEIGYINNARDRAKLVDSSFQETVAQAIVDGIRGYIEASLPESTAGPVDSDD